MAPTPVNPSFRPRMLLRRHWPLLAVLVPCLLLAAGSENLRILLRYDRAAIGEGEWWRLFTGNFVHLGAGHLAEDMAGLVLLWFLFEDVLAGWRMVAVVIVGAWGVGTGLYLGDPWLEWYAGISGALDAIWAVGAMALLQKRDRFGWALAGLLCAKLVYEQYFGPLPFSTASTGGTVIVDAHLYGALTGAVLGFGDALLGHRIMRAVKRSGDHP